MLNLTFFNFQLCPGVRDDLSTVKNLLKSTDDKPRDILHTSSKSALCLLSSRDHNFKVFKLGILCKMHVGLHVFRDDGEKLTANLIGFDDDCTKKESVLLSVF